MVFIDTNYFLRFFQDDVPVQHQQVTKLFNRAASGKSELCTNTIVVFEVYWVLRSSYGKKHPFLKKVLVEISRLDFIFIDNREILVDAINDFENHDYDLEDSYHLAYCRHHQISQLATFDQKLAKEFIFQEF